MTSNFSVRGPQEPRTVGIDALEENWTFRRSRLSIIARIGRWRTRQSFGSPPAFKVIKPIEKRKRWIVYFMYLPQGKITEAHQFSLTRLRKVTQAALLVICATANRAEIPAEVFEIADALYWKSLEGFDFSAYAIAISAIAEASSGADALFMNDSVLGPFCNLDHIWSRMQWQLTGFTAFRRGQNHIQSYAFYLKNITPELAANMSSIISIERSIDTYEAVLHQQEIRMAAVASKTMSVGALWYADNKTSADPSLFAALPLIEAGFPFLKRALLTKHAGIYPRDQILAVLDAHGHPLPMALSA